MIDTQKSIEGIIVKGIGGFYYVSTPGGTVECHARGKFRKDELSPIVGDYVSLLLNPEGTGSICKIHERKNFLIRPGVSNVDALVLVSALRSPMPDFLLIDKLLVTAASKGIEGIICLNKTDLAADEEETERFCEIYRKAGYSVIAASAKTGEGVKEIQSLIKGRTVAFAGLSGVGKSSLLKRITGADLQVGSVSRIERGKHTTRHVELIEAAGGYVFDTPGFSRLEADTLRAADLWQFFPEIAPLHGTCRFRTCNHIGEPVCSVKEAVNGGSIAQNRYDSYIEIYNKLKDIKDWERKD